MKVSYKFFLFSSVENFWGLGSWLVISLGLGLEYLLLCSVL